MVLKRKRPIGTTSAATEASPSGLKRKPSTPRIVKKYSFRHTITRPKSWDNSEETYECKYKFEVNDDNHDDDEEHDFNNADERQGGGIDLLIAVQWEVKGAMRGDDHRAWSAWTREKKFQLPSDKLSLYDDSLKNQLQGIISPIVLNNLGLASTDVHEAITQLLVCYAAVLYIESKQQFDGDYYSISSNWIPLNVYIHLQIQSPISTRENCNKINPWAKYELTHFIHGLRPMKRTINERNENDLEKVCPICLENCKVERQLVRMASCDHIYHEHCIGKWLAARSDCPLCRLSMPPESRWRRSDYLIGWR